MSDSVTPMTAAEWYEATALDVAEKAKAIKDNRLAIATTLADMRKRADENGDDWQDVLDLYVRPKLNLVIGPREVRRLVSIGSAPDPAQAMAVERERNRQAVAHHKAGLTKSADRGPPVQRALAAVQSLPEPERKAVVEALSADAGPKRIAAPEKSPRERLRVAIREADDDDLRAVLAEPETWNRLRVLLSAGRTTDPLPPHDPETGEIYENGEHQPGPIKNPLPVGDACSGSSSEAPLASGAGAAQGRCEPAAPPIQGSAARLASVPHPPAEAHDDRFAEPPPVAGTAADSIPPAGLTDDDFPDIPSFLDRRGELARTTDDPAAPDETPAPPKRVRA